MWAERNRVRPRRDEEPKPSRWWRSRWSVALPASKARNRFLGLGFGGRPQRGGQQPARISPSQSPARQSGNERWLARVPGAGAARFSAYRHALARRSGGRSSTLSLGAYYPVQPEALPAGHAPQSRTATPPTLRGRIQLPAQPPHYGDQSISPTRAGLSHNQHYHLQGVDRRAGSSLIFIFGYILRQNDPKYRDVQWGDGRDYFMSLLRSMAFSAVWHTQWKIGVASEDSIGNVMLHASPGFITLVDTPTLGTVTMIGEDALDLRLADDRNRHEPLVERDMRIVKHRPDLNRDPASHFSDFGGWIGRTLLSGLCLSVLRSFFGNGLVFNNLRMTFSNSDLLKLSSVIGCFTKTVSGANPENHF